MTHSLTVLDLFCGCGGMSLGFVKAGYKVVQGIDFDKAALETFQKNHNARILQTDIREMSNDKLLQTIKDEEIDVVIGGPPCQGLSLSGPRKFHDPRNKLFLSFIEITDKIQPKGFVLENVPGLISLYNGQIKEEIIKEFTKIGYNVSWNMLLAADYGVPQLRKRVFFVGLKDNGFFKFPNKTHFEKKSLLLTDKKRITCKDAIGDLPPLEYDDVGTEKQDYPMPPQNEYQELMRLNSEYVYNHIAVRHSERVKQIIQLVPDGGNYKDLPEKYRNTRNFNIAWTRFNSNLPAPTIDTGHRHHFHYKYNRVPTVREAARIQSFPDTFVFYGNKTQQNKQVGNAVPPLLAEVLGKELLKWL